MDKTTQAGLAEFFGTFTLVFLGAGAGALAGDNGIGLAGVALTHGIALMFIIYTWGWISGAHVNPAVTLGVMLSGNISFGKSILYWIAQFAGGAAAAYLLVYLLGSESNLGQTIGSLTPVAEKAGDPVKVIVIEAVLTFFLVCSVLSNGIAGKNSNLVGVAIGFVLIADIMFGGSLTGASMNPARTFGPALAKNNLSYVWLYIVGPAIGGIVAALVYGGLFLAPESGTIDDIQKKKNR
jgi:MIP family channel proteins